MLLPLEPPRAWTAQRRPRLCPQLPPRHRPPTRRPSQLPQQPAAQLRPRTELWCSGWIASAGRLPWL
eukprot:5924304-Heterocapsa_arctica.AAC.1